MYIQFNVQIRCIYIVAARPTGNLTTFYNNVKAFLIEFGAEVKGHVHSCK